MIEKYFFEIPIFRLTRESFKKEHERRINELAKYLARGKEPTDRDVDNATMWLDHQSYRYSEMVGMIRLYGLGNQFRGEYFFLSNKRIRYNLKNKKWAYFGKLFEFTVYEDEKNKDIFNRILKKLKDSEVKFKGRFIDTQSFLNIGECINYKKLLI